MREPLCIVFHLLMIGRISTCNFYLSECLCLAQPVPVTEVQSSNEIATIPCGTQLPTSVITDAPIIWCPRFDRPVPVPNCQQKPCDLLLSAEPRISLRQFAASA